MSPIHDPLDETRSYQSTTNTPGNDDLSATTDDPGHDGKLRGMLRPSHLRDEVWPAMRTRLGDGGEDLARTARRHPVPLALIGAGLGWWAAEMATGRSLLGARREDQETGYPPDYRTGARGDELGPDVDGKAGDGTLGALGERAGNVRSRAAEALAGARRTVGERAGHLRQRAGAGLRSSRRRARLGFWQAMESSPFVLGTAALGAGVLTGLALPTSRLEDEKLGTRRDHLLDEARRAGRDAIAKGAHVAEEATASAREALAHSAASEQGLGERLKAASEEARRAARRAARDEGTDVSAGSPAREADGADRGAAGPRVDPSTSGIGGTLEPSVGRQPGASVTSGRSHPSPGSNHEVASGGPRPSSPAAPTGGSISAERALLDPSRRRSDDETPG
jgi:hypothetical protein